MAHVFMQNSTNFLTFTTKICVFTFFRPDSRVSRSKPRSHTTFSSGVNTSKGVSGTFKRGIDRE